MAKTNSFVRENSIKKTDGKLSNAFMDHARKQQIDEPMKKHEL